MTDVTVTVHRPSSRSAVMLALSPYGEVKPYKNLKSAFRIQVRDDLEADFMLTVANDDRISGTAYGESRVPTVALQEEFIYEGRLFTDKIGALRLKATVDANRGVFNPWWKQPDFFKWRYDTDRLGQGTIIAIVDGGIRWGHPEFAKNPSRVTRIFNYSTSQLGASNHGTACAAISAGDKIGIAPEAELWDVKTFPDDGGSTTTQAIIDGLDATLGAAIDPLMNPDGKAVIVNCSFGSAADNLANPYGSIIADMQNEGIIVLIAAGNDGSDLDSTFNAWPAESSEYAVGALHYDGRRAAFSNYGLRVKLYGFGHRVMGAGYPGGNKYGDISGTSFATPYLCGCLATWMPGRWVPQDATQVRTLMTDYMAFCSEGVYGQSVREHVGDALVPGAVIGRASYFPVLPGDVIVPQINVVARFGTAEYGVLGWKTRATPIIGGANYGATGQTMGAAVFFEGPFEWDQGGPWMDPLYVPTGWTIDNDRVKNRSGVSGDGMFVVNDANLQFKEYWEIDVKGPAAGMVVGVTKTSNLANHDEATTGMGAAGVAWGADGSLVADGVAQTATITYAQGDRLMLAYDTATGEFWCGKNGVWAATPGVNAALATTATGASRAAFSVPDGSALQLYGTSNHQLYIITGFTGFNLGEEVEWKFDATLVSTSHLLSENDTRVTDNGGGSNYRPIIPTTSFIDPATPGKVYWEVALLAGPTAFNGYNGVVGDTFLAAYPPPNNVTNPVYGGVYNWRGNGDIWGPNGTVFVSGATSTYGVGDRLMFCLEPTTGALWFGKNGVWDRDPDTDAPRFNQPIENMWPFGQTRGVAVSVKLISLTPDFLYAKPAGAVSLGTLS